MKSCGHTFRPTLLPLLAGLALVDFPPIAMAADADPTPRTTSTAAPAGPRAGGAPAVSSASLEASSGVPWNPPSAVPRRRAWEQVVLLPGRIVSLPLSGLGYVTDQTLGYVEANNLLARLSFASRSLPEKAGISIAPARLGSGSGHGLTLGLHTPFLSGTLKNRVRADFGLTLRQYNRTLVTVQGRPARLQYAYDWRPEEQFYGFGLATSEDSVSGFASQTESVRGSARWAWNRDTENAPPRTEVNVWAGPRTAVTRTARETGMISFDERFPGIGETRLNRRVEHLIYGGSFSTDWRVGNERWEKGWRFRFDAERYDRPKRLTALRIGRTRGAQFTRLVYETETGFSFMRDPRTVRVLLKVMDQSVTSDRQHFLLSDLATLGGREGLAGFETGRFRDLDLMMTKVSYVFPIVRRLELDLHSEWGGVYSNVWADPRLSTLKNSYGIALRGRHKSGPIGSFGVDFSREATRVRFRFGGVE